MIDRKKVINELVSHIENALSVDSDYVDCIPTDLLQYAVALLKADQTYLQEQDEKIKKLHLLLNTQLSLADQTKKELEDEISELRETLTEMSMNGGTGNQHDVCKFLLKLMDVIEKRQRGKDCATD